MKKSIGLTCLCLLTIIFAHAQKEDYKVVFDLSSRDTVNQQTLIRELQFIRSTSPAAKITVVLYGHGMDLAVKGRTKLEGELRPLIADPNISFKVCGYTLQRNNVDKSQLLVGVEVVPDGIYEIFSKQKEGWGYVKVGH
jgi:intracellular sulfur oxidation DsrE/DsrF family protein